jgi:hypothetical protein
MTQLGTAIDSAKKFSDRINSEPEDTKVIDIINEEEIKKSSLFFLGDA